MVTAPSFSHLSRPFHLSYGLLKVNPPGAGEPPLAHFPLFFVGRDWWVAAGLLKRRGLVAGLGVGRWQIRVGIAEGSPGVTPGIRGMVSFGRTVNLVLLFFFVVGGS